jgi:tellurite resistance protein
MIRGLQSKTLTRLRDHLLVTGERKSLFLAGAQAYEHPLEGDDEAKAYFDAVAEAMYLMIASDGKLEESERHVLRGALRDLTANQMHTAAIEKLVGEFDAALKAQGQPARVAAVCEVLKERQEAAEAAFVLAAAVAFADDEIADSENDMLNALAEQLNISSERAEELLDELEQDSAELPTSGFSFGCFCLLT